MRLKLFVLFSLAVNAIYATPAGVMQWTGGASSGFCQDTELYCTSLQLINDSTGITSTYNAWESGQGAWIEYNAGRSFTVTSAGDFLVSETATVTGSGYACNSQSMCDDMTTEFQAGAYLAGISLPISDSQIELLQGNAADYARSAVGALPLPWNPITLTDSSSTIVFLSAGDYTLWQGMNADTLSAESTTLQLSHTTSIVGIDSPDPVPEPRWVGLLLVLSALSVACMRRVAGLRWS